MSKDANFQQEYGLFIDGAWTKGSEGALLTAYNPATGEKLAQFIDATNEDVDQAVAAATKAQPAWGKLSITERSHYLLKIADIVEENLDHLALCETLDNGKPINETLYSDLPGVVDHFRYFAGVLRSEEGGAQMLTDQMMSLVLREPIGVVGQVVPWNFPIMMAAWKIAPALAAGNAIVITPSSSTSLSLLEFARLIEDVLPAGVLNIITGRGSKSGEYMLHHPGIKKLAFTGSTKVGTHVGEVAAQRLVPATLELGGKSANIFFDDMNFEQALDGALMGILANQGQVCCAGSRIFVQAGIYDKFMPALIEKFKQVKVGLPWLTETEMGAQVSESQMNKILAWIDQGVADGAEIAVGGKRLETGELKDGFFLEPTLLTNVTNQMAVCQEEIFGPVATVMKFNEIDEVIDLANDSDYGLAGGVWTTNLNTAMKVARGIQTGRVWVNTYNQTPAGAPFGGYKKSGIGRETYKTMLDTYSQTKSIMINLKE